MYSERRLSVYLSVSNIALWGKDSPPTQRHNQWGRGNKYMKYTLEFNYSTTLTEELQCSEKHNNIDLNFR